MIEMSNSQLYPSNLHLIKRFSDRKSVNFRAFFNVFKVINAQVTFVEGLLPGSIRTVRVIDR